MNEMVTAPFSSAEGCRGEPLQQRQKLAGQSWGIWHRDSCRMQLLVAFEDPAGTSRGPSPGHQALSYGIVPGAGDWPAWSHPHSCLCLGTEKG